jgi:hypothetical protein
MNALPLACFQAAFGRALMHDAVAADRRLGSLQRQPGFAVYRNTVLRGCIDALHASYPAVLRLVGEQWFRAAAAAYVRTHWPQQPMLVDYGDGFAAFLADFPPALELPYLSAVAQLDRCWTESHLAADAPVLDAADVAAQLQAGDGRIDALKLSIHPAARWRWFDAVPALTIWHRNRADVFDDGEFAWHGEGALLTRPLGAVQWRPLSPAGVALLDACAAGAPLAVALDAAAATADAQEIGQLLPALIEAGAFAGLS